MLRFSKSESPFEKELKKLRSSGKDILPGEIWMIPNEDVFFVESKLPGFEVKEYPTRPILILSRQEDCKDMSTISVLTCTFTTRTDIVNQTDCLLSPTEGGLKEESLAQLGNIQAILKTRLVEKKGQLTKEQFDLVRTVMLMNFGFIPRP